MNFLPVPDIGRLAGGVQAVNWQLEHNVLAEEGLSRIQQRVVLDGSRWRATLQWRDSQKFDAELLTSFLAKASRGDSWLYVSPPQNTIRGGFSAPELVAGATFLDEDATRWTASGSVLSINARRLKVRNSGAAIGTATRTLSVTQDQPHTFVIDLHEGNVAQWRVRLLDGSNNVEHVSYYDRAGRIAIVHLPSSGTLKLELGCNTDDDADYVFFGPVSGARSLLVQNSLSVGNRVGVKGGPASTSGALKAGQYLTLRLWNGWQMVRLTEDLDTDSNGDGEIVFEPALRAEPWGGGPIVVQKPFCRMLIPQAAVSYDIRPPDFHGVAAEVVEDPTPYYDEIPQDTDIVWQWHAATLSGEPSIGNGAPTNTSDGSDNYYFDSDGLLKTISAADDRIFEFNPITGALKGQRFQGARTNLALHSEDLTQSAWVKTDSTITADQAVAPDGTTAMDLVTEGVAGTAAVHQNYTGTANAHQVFFKFLKRVNHDWAQMLIYEAAASANTVRAWFNLRTGEKGTANAGGTGTVPQAFMYDVGDGIYLCILMGAVGNSATALRMQTNSASADASSTRVNNAKRYEWGAQVENNVPLWSSYIKTTTATVQRTADGDTLALNLIPGLTESEYTIEAEMLLDHVETSATTFRDAVALDDGTADEVARISMAAAESDLDATVRDGGVDQASMDGAQISADVPYRSALGAKLNDFVYSTNGAAVTTDVSGTMPAVTTLRKGARASGDGHLFGYLRRVTVRKAKKPNRMVRSLSA